MVCLTPRLTVKRTMVCLTLMLTVKRTMVKFSSCFFCFVFKYWTIILLISNNWYFLCSMLFNWYTDDIFYCFKKCFMLHNLVSLDASIKNNKQHAWWSWMLNIFLDVELIRYCMIVADLISSTWFLVIETKMNNYRNKNKNYNRSIIYLSGVSLRVNCFVICIHEDTYIDIYKSKYTLA